MRKLLLPFLLAAAAVFAAGDEQAVAASVEKFNEAAHKGDEATLKTLLGDDLVYVHSSALTETKDQCIAALVKGKPEFKHSEQKIRVYGKTALVEAKVVAHTTPQGKPTVIPLTMLQVWVKQGSGWKMVARRTTKLPTT
ncbi:MAG: nuclear transport factor 2 family protein [Bryobacteraceae bacterium]